MPRTNEAFSCVKIDAQIEDLGRPMAFAEAEMPLKMTLGSSRVPLFLSVCLAHSDALKQVAASRAHPPKRHDVGSVLACAR